MKSSRIIRFCFAAAAAFAPGCIIDNNSSGPADTQIEFQETTNLGYTCTGPLTLWQITARENQEAGSAGCEQPILFEHLAPNAVYTFDITGYAGQRLCWQGSCQVAATAGIRTYADCSAAIAHLCGL